MSSALSLETGEGLDLARDKELQGSLGGVNRIFWQNLMLLPHQIQIHQHTHIPTTNAQLHRMGLVDYSDSDASDVE